MTGDVSPRDEFLRLEADLRGDGIIIADRLHRTDGRFDPTVACYIMRHYSERLRFLAEEVEGIAFIEEARRKQQAIEEEMMEEEDALDAQEGTDAAPEDP